MFDTLSSRGFSTNHGAEPALKDEALLRATYITYVLLIVLICGYGSELVVVFANARSYSGLSSGEEFNPREFSDGLRSARPFIRCNSQQNGCALLLLQ